MKFVVHTKIKHLVPPEVTLKLINAVEPWQKQWGGKIEQTWSFAGDPPPEFSPVSRLVLKP
jgi:hypothetical protein